MESKIKQYVNYQFRFKDDGETEDVKAEIIANLIDRYNDLLEKGYENEKAYVEAIKQMGDFSSEFEDKTSKEYSIKPNFVDVALICATVLAMFSTVLLLFSIIAGTILTSISIALYGSGSYYLYAKAQYVKKENKDIEEHNILLSKIIKYLKTNFIFWAINISLIIANIISSIITLIFVPAGFDNIYSVIILISFCFIIILIIMLIIMVKIYSKIIVQYIYLTGNEDPKSYLSDSYEFIKGKELEKGWIAKKYLSFTGKRFVPIIALLVILITLLPLTSRYEDYSFKVKAVNIVYQVIDSFQYYIWPFGLFILIIIIVITVISIIHLIKNKTKNNLLLILLYIVFLPSLLVFMNAYNDEINFTDYYYREFVSYEIILLILLISGICLIARLFVKRKLKNIESKVE